jgi:hypothetical protein
MNRSCMDCGKPVHLCMGFVLASDFLEALAKKIPWTSVRERCGKCVEIASGSVTASLLVN